MFAIQLFKDFISLFYPDICLCCGEGLGVKEEFICTICLYKLPKTNFHLNADNELEKAFWGRAKLNAAAAYFYFQKGNAIQTLVHELKYKGKKELGTYIGKCYGKELLQSPRFTETELIIPVPLHPKKLRRRGYNQSAFFAQGIAESMGKIFVEDSLIRNVETETQTRKSRMLRWENVQGIFSVVKKEKIEGKNVLLVDDVVTTGATLEACIGELAKVPVASVRIASIGYAIF